jgi:hypothetical protein
VKLKTGLILVLALAAGPAAAQTGTFGPKPKQTWSPGYTPPSASGPRSYGVPAPAAPTGPRTNTGRIYGAPDAATPGAPKPYKPYSGSSTYANPYGGNAGGGANDCERSVYTNACRNR